MIGASLVIRSLLFWAVTSTISMASASAALIELRGRVENVDVWKDGGRSTKKRPCAWMEVRYHFYVHLAALPDEPVAKVRHRTHWCYDGKRTYQNGVGSSSVGTTITFDRLGVVDQVLANLEIHDREKDYYRYRKRAYGGIMGRSSITLSYGPIKGYFLRRSFFLKNFMHFDGSVHAGRDVTASSQGEPGEPLEAGPQEQTPVPNASVAPPAVWLPAILGVLLEDE